MSNQSHEVKAPTTTKQPAKSPTPEPVNGAEVAAASSDLLGWSGAPSVQGQAGRLGNRQLPALQRQRLAEEIGQMQGNRHLQRVMASLKRNGPDAPNQGNLPMRGGAIDLDKIGNSGAQPDS